MRETLWEIRRHLQNVLGDPVGRSLARECFWGVAGGWNPLEKLCGDHWEAERPPEIVFEGFQGGGGTP